MKESRELSSFISLIAHYLRRALDAGLLTFYVDVPEGGLLEQAAHLVLVLKRHLLHVQAPVAFTWKGQRVERLAGCLFPLHLVFVSYCCVVLLTYLP